MGRKDSESIAIGVALWVAGVVALVLLGGHPLFPRLALPAVLTLTPPVAWTVARLHLRDVATAHAQAAGTRLSLLLLAVQFPLDAGLFVSIFRFGLPELTPAAQGASVVALLVAYFWLLIVPWRVGKQAGAG